ncbi:cobalamin biosynthesis protein [Comamonas sp. GB3 AK4-5]|uniref:cobalamin biosynthesis protein n=1 Tax=Comamonas sp. GB3 AK4-5 TaxID=3231487 RepID=UPI00351F13E8
MRDHACLVLGLGLRAQAQASDVQALWLRAQTALPALQRFCAVAVLQGKEQHPALREWRAALLFDTTLVAVPAQDLPGQPVATQSARLLARYGTGSVAEAVALSAAGPASTLLLPRMVADDGGATLAAALRRSGPLNCCLAAARAVTESQGVTA